MPRTLPKSWIGLHYKRDDGRICVVLDVQALKTIENLDKKATRMVWLKCRCWQDADPRRIVGRRRAVTCLSCLAA